MRFDFCSLAYHLAKAEIGRHVVMIGIYRLESCANKLGK